MVTENQLLVGYVGGVYSLMFFLRGVEGLIASDMTKVVIWMVGAAIVAILGLTLLWVAPLEIGDAAETP